jgi:hypothetical protein
MSGTVATLSARVLVVAVLAAGITGCSRSDEEPMTYDNVVDTVRSIAYEPDDLGELLGHRVVLDLRPFGTTAGYYVDEVHEISFGCRDKDREFRGGHHVVARVVDFNALPSGVTTITLDKCSAGTASS